MRRYCYDLETLKGLFTATFINYDTDEIHQFIIGEDFENQLEELKEFVKGIDYLIGFNSQSFDDPILNYVIQQNVVFPEIIYGVAQDLINQQNEYNRNDPYKKYKWNKPWKSIDLFLYWSKMLRLSKKLSLKYFESNMDLKIQEMPIPHNKESFTQEEIKLVLDYNLTDVKATKELAKRLKDEINLRLYAQNIYGFDCMSWDGVKLGLNILLKIYCDKNGYDIEKVKKLRTIRTSIVLKDIILPEIKFTPTEDLSYRWIKVGKSDVKLFKSFYALHQDLIKQTVTSTDQINYRVIYKGTIYDIKSGGLHSFHPEPSIIKPTENQSYIDMDCSSYYPTLGGIWNFVPEHLKEGKFNEDLLQIKDERVSSKKTDPNKAALLKLALNGGFYGNTNNEYTAMQDLACMLSITLNGQLFLLMYCEMCEEAGIKVDMANTDGITYLVDNQLLNEFYDISKKWESISKMSLEEVKYKEVYRTSINDYLAVKYNGELKAKGEFIFEKVLDGSNEFLIIPIAVKEYFVNNIPVEDTIRNHWNIYDFCCSKKISRDYEIIYNGKKQQQLNRFYASKKGAYLYKRKLNLTEKQQKAGKVSNLEHVFKESGVRILNDVSSLYPNELEVDFDFYIRAAKQRIKVFSKEQLSLF
jgi:hypothetical protein